MTAINSMQQKKLKIDLEKLHDHSMCFFDSFGRLIAEWSAIERAFYTWFASVSGMKDAMARSIFYSGKSFNSRADMLEAAFGNNQSNMPPLDMEFVKASLKKALGIAWCTENLRWTSFTTTAQKHSYSWSLRRVRTSSALPQ